MQTRNLITLQRTDTFQRTRKTRRRLEQVGANWCHNLLSSCNHMMNPYLVPTVFQVYLSYIYGCKNKTSRYQNMLCKVHWFLSSKSLLLLMVFLFFNIVQCSLNRVNKNIGLLMFNFVSVIYNVMSNSSALWEKLIPTYILVEVVPTVVLLAYHHTVGNCRLVQTAHRW